MCGLIEIAGFSYLLLHSVYCRMLFGLKYIYREKSSLTQLIVEKGRDILIASKELWIYFIGVCVHMRVCVLTQLCPALCNPKDCSPPGSSVHGIAQARLGCHFFLQGIFLTQGLNPRNQRLLCLLHWPVDFLPLRHLESPIFGC